MNILGLLYLIITSFGGMALAAWLFPFSRLTPILVGPAIGLITTTELTLLLSLTLGFTPVSIGGSILLFIFCVFLLSRQKFRFPQKLNFDINHIVKKIKTHWPFLFILITIGGFCTYIFSTQVLAPSELGLLTGSGGLYGDTAMHAAFTMSLAEQGLPPQNPLFAGQPLIYPFLINFLAAIFLKLGLTLRWAFVLPQLVFVLATLTLLYVVIKSLTTKQTFVIASLIFFLGWGFGFSEYLKTGLATGDWNVTREYTNNIEGFVFHNVLTGLIFPERSFLPGLVIGLLITSLVIQVEKVQKVVKVDKGVSKRFPFSTFSTLSTSSTFIAIGILLGILPLWHTHTFIFFVVNLFFWLGLPRLFLLFTKKRATAIKELLLLGIPALILAAPVLLWLGTRISRGSFIHFSLGWGRGQNQFLFWFKNAGLVLPLGLAGLITMRKQVRFLFVPVFIMFIIANVVIFQPWDWDNIKLFSWIFLFLSILAGHALAQIWHIRLIRLIWPALLISLVASGILSLVNQSQHTFTVYDNQDINLAQWVKQNTPPSAVFLVDPWPNHPVPGLTGRSAYIGYPGHLWVHGIDYGGREEQTKKILAGDLTLLSDLEIPIDYLVTPRVTSWQSWASLTQVFQNPKFTVYEISK